LSDPSGQLLVHCKSKEDDLGLHYIAVNDEFQWHFRNEVFKQTLFWCRLQPSHNIRAAAFEAYVNNEDQTPKEYGYHNYWIGKDDGVYSKRMNHNNNQWEEKLQFRWE
ncbi:unnamed protein product, partial [Linum tenue]